MSIDVKIRIGLLAVSAFAALAMAHGLYLGPLDVIGGGSPPC